MLRSFLKKIYSGIKIDISDEYINWLCYANAGMFNRGNLYSIDYAVKNLPSDHPILEIGSFCGLSTNIIAYYLKKNSKNPLFFTCDKWIFEGAENINSIEGSTVTNESYREYVKFIFKYNVDFFSSTAMLHTIEEFSDDFFRMWKDKVVAKDVFDNDVKLGGKLSFCYIDGNHTYEYALRDFINTDEFLDVGGFILFDDSSNRSPFGLHQLMKEIQKGKRYELIIKNPNYLFKKIKD